MTAFNFRVQPALAAAALAFALPSLAAADDGLAVTDAYLRALPGAPTGAAYMVIKNHTETDDRLTGARSDAAERVELHTHAVDAQGMMQMLHVPEGFEIPAGGSHTLARGGDHVMFMGLARPLAQGDTVELTLEFETGEDQTVTIPVDMEREDAARGMEMDAPEDHGDDGGHEMTAPSN